MDAFRGPHGNFGRKSWLNARAAGYNPMQIKTAIQQQAKYNNALVGAGLRNDFMKNYRGYAHNLSRFQGPEGNLGLKYYNQAKAAGYTPAEIPDLAEASGMFLPEGAYAQWQKDMAEGGPSPMELPGTNEGGGVVEGYTAQGLASPTGPTHATGSMSEAFGRPSSPGAQNRLTKQQQAAAAAALMINPLG